MESNKVMKVAIIGAGAAGLAALRHLTCRTPYQDADARHEEEDPVQFDVVCFEMASEVGGTWLYTDRTGKDELGRPIFSSMYKNLVTNLPKECMAFLDFPFREDLPSFMRHEEVLKYFQDYADYFGLLKYIQFQRQAVLVKPIPEPSAKFGVRWEVTTQDALDLEDPSRTEVFDAIIVANGKYSVPSMPTLPGMDTFQGQLMHSHDYRHPEKFSNQVLVLLGAGLSGRDIAIELSAVATRIYLSHNKEPLESRLPHNVEERPGVLSLGPGSRVTFLDGSTEDVDTLMFCTGYCNDYGFLAPECGVEVFDQRVWPVYKHFINTKFPSMAILGVCTYVIPFPLYDIQIQLFRAVLEDRVTLPSESEMNEDIEADYQARLAEGQLHRHCQSMLGRAFSYMDQLADMAQTKKIPKVYRDSHSWALRYRSTDILNYKRMNFPSTDNKAEHLAK